MDGSKTMALPCLALDTAAAEMRLGALHSEDAARAALSDALAGGSLVEEAEALLQRARFFSSSVNPQATLDAVTRAQHIFGALGAVVQAAQCEVAAARALLDLGQEREALERVRRVLDERELPEHARVAGMVVMAHSQARLGQPDAALQTLLESAAPLSEAGGAADRIQVRKAVAIVRLQVMLSLDFPHLLGGPARVDAPLVDRLPRQHFLEVLDATEVALPTGERCAHLEIVRQVILGLYEPAGPAVERLAGLVADTIGSDPPTAAWAAYALALIHKNRRELPAAQQSVDRCLAISAQWGLKAIARHAFLQRSLIREAVEDFRGALQAYKVFADMRLRSVAFDAGPVDGAATPKPSAEEPRGPTRNSARKPLESRHVRRAIRFIESNLGVPISVSDIAADCKVSRRTLEIAFKQNKSCTLAYYVKRRRLETAAGLLRFSALLVSEIASSVGYRWPSAFARDFVSHYGVKPSEWRALNAHDSVGDAEHDLGASRPPPP